MLPTTERILVVTRTYERFCFYVDRMVSYSGDFHERIKYVYIRDMNDAYGYPKDSKIIVLGMFHPNILEQLYGNGFSNMEKVAD